LWANHSLYPSAQYSEIRYFKINWLYITAPPRNMKEIAVIRLKINIAKRLL
jgi:hypothetical protein